MLTATIPPASVATDGFLTADEVARKLRRSAKTVRYWVANEGLPTMRVRRRLFFDPAEVDAWLRARNDAPPVAPDDHRTAIKRLVDAAPELTAEQADRIRAVLTSGAA